MDVADPVDDWLADDDEWLPPNVAAAEAVEAQEAPQAPDEPAPAPARAALPSSPKPAPPREPDLTPVPFPLAAAPDADPVPAPPPSPFAPQVAFGWEKPEVTAPKSTSAPPPPPANPAVARIRIAARRVNAHPQLAVDDEASQRDRRQQVLAHLMSDESEPPDSQTAAEWAAMCTKLKPHVEPEPEPNYWRWSRQ
jgi:hypothetical protein